MSENYIRFDWAIKRLLRNKADFGAVNGLLSCLLKKQIMVTKVLESEGNQDYEEQKFNRVDVLVEDEKGEKIIIEIQNNYQVDYYHRMLFGVSKVVCDYIKKGDNYDKINKVFAVSIVYFELGQGSDYVYHCKSKFRGIHTNDVLGLSKAQKRRYGREKIGDIFPEYYLLRVENFDKIATTPLDEWMHYLKTTKIPDNFTAQGLDEIRSKQKIDDLPEEERNTYYHHLDQLHYEEGVIEHHRLEAKIEGEKIGIEKGEAIGIQKGEAIGIQKGEAIGIQKGKLEIAKNLKTLGLSLEQIAKATDLTIDEIERL